MADYELALQLSREQEEPNLKKARSTLASDEEFARSLQKSEQAKTEKSTASCHQCKASVSMDDIYILDDCNHRFCRNCLKTYVASEVLKTVTIECPLKECTKELSVRDMKDLLPEIKKNSLFNPTKSSGKATERIMAELKHIAKSDPKKNGYSVEPMDDNIYKWELKLFDFDKTDPIGQDMNTYKVKNILLHVIFPPSYPFSPPYIRVIRPRFQYRTGHVTIGGSICTEMLTNKGWSPANTVEAVIVSIRANLIVGGARLDPYNKVDYTEQEAKDAFDRMVRDHGWH
eukprot:TRINITY_DN4822_c0_g1_i1.p1 TRINITY_DN4822_c0_g1~~TRINITY_DN4822_c0_g1_i1.p1  ORF type:complete len:335 (+),score=75.90 TRINITY_DN4822_c0_g1_i1:145-1005(+)